jgi:protein O-GlcNAc transferase
MRQAGYDAESILDLATQEHENGRIEEAKKGYLQVLTLNQDHPKALHLLGVVAFQLNQVDLARSLMEHALARYPDYIDALFNLGLVCLRQGDNSKAVEMNSRILQINPDHEKARINLDRAQTAMNSSQKENISKLDEETDETDQVTQQLQKARNLSAKGEMIQACDLLQTALSENPDRFEDILVEVAGVLQKMGMIDESRKRFQQVLKANPNNYEALYGLGRLEHEQKQLGQAKQYFSQAIQLKPGDIAALIALGNTCRSAGDLDAALEAYDRILNINPDHALALTNKASVLHQVQRFDESFDLLQKAINIDPNLFSAHNNLGNYYLVRGDFQKAIPAYQKALTLNDRSAETHNNLGIACRNLDWLEQAVSILQRAVQLKPDYAEAWINLGTAYDSLKRLPDSIQAYEQALQILPNDSVALSGYLLQLRQACQWDKLAEIEKRVASCTNHELHTGKKTGEMPFLNLVRSDDQRLNHEVAKVWSREIEARIPRVFEHQSALISKPKLHIGYLSSNYRRHAMAYLVQGLVREHDRSRFQITCYSCNRLDVSQEGSHLRQIADRFVDFYAVSDKDAAQQIYEDQVDILVDLMGFTLFHRMDICAYRPAPVQVRYLGMAGTTGAGFFDYLLTDPVVTPPEVQDCYSECLVHMPDCYQVNDFDEIADIDHPQRQEFCLPEGAFVMSCMCTAYKLDPTMFACWMELLKEIPDSVLWLLGGSDLVVANIKRQAQSHGLDTGRIIFAEQLPHKAHMKRLGLADIALDTRMVTGALTTSEALWAGVPIVTIKGNHFASRMSASILQAVGLSDLVTCSLDEYKNLVLRLASQPNELNEIRNTLEQNKIKSPLFDTKKTTRDIESAYMKMWDIYISGAHPHPFKVPGSLLEEVHSSQFTVHS